MSHQSQNNFIIEVRSCFPEFFKNSKVLEIGSLNINGSVRSFFTDCQYIGIDVAPGKDVDIVCEGQLYDAEDGSFDHVISCEVMEHNPYWRETFNNMVRLCKPGGLITMTCATVGRTEHGTTSSSPESSPLTIEKGWNYYQNLAAPDFINLCSIDDKFNEYNFWVDWASFDLCFVGFKKGKEFSAKELRAKYHELDKYFKNVNRNFTCVRRLIIAKIGADYLYGKLRKIKYG